uniref:Uncharacterized protein n=1 Tax=Stomoxys calcitrans TaxID=35570 RepID=A0A1I8PH34_STOCA
MHKLFIVISLLIALTTALTIYGKPYIRIRQGANPNQLIISVRHPCTNQTRTTSIAIPKKEVDFHKETPKDYNNFSSTPERISKGQSFTIEKNTIQLNYEATRQQHSNATPANKTIFNYETTTLLYSIYLNENTVSKKLDQPYNTATKVQTQTSNRNKGDDDDRNTPAKGRDVATKDTSKDRKYSSEKELQLLTSADARLITSEVNNEAVTSKQESTIGSPSTSLKVEEDAINSIAGLTVITSDPSEDTSVYPAKETTLLPATLEADSNSNHQPYNIANRVQTQTSNRFKGDDDVSNTPVTDPDVATKDTSKDRYYSSENETTLTSADARLITSEVNNEAATSNQESTKGPPSTNLRVGEDTDNPIAGLIVITSDPSEDTSAYPVTLLPAAIEVDSTLDNKPYNIANEVQTQISHRNIGHDDMNTPAKGPHLARSDTNQDRSYSSEYETTLQLLTTDGASPITSEVNIEASTSNQYSTKGLSTNLKVVEDTDNSIAVLTVMTVNPSVYTSDYSVKGTTLLPATLEVDSTPNTEPFDYVATSNQDSIIKPTSTTLKVDKKVLRNDAQEFTDITTASLDVVTIDSSEDASDSSESEMKPPITTQVADSTTTNAPSDIATWYQVLTMKQSTTSREETPNSDTQLHIDNKTGGLEVVTIVSSKDGRNSSKNEITLQPKPPSEVKEDSIKVPTGTISEGEKVTYISALQKDMDFTTADDTSGDTRDSPENASTMQPTTNQSIGERQRTTEVIDDVTTLKQDPTKVRLSKTLKVQQKTLILHKQVDMDNTSMGLDIVTVGATKYKNDSSDTESTLQPITSEAEIPTTFGANDDATTMNKNSNIESRDTKLEIEAVTPNPDSQEDTNNTTVGSDAVETDRSEYTSNYTDNENTMLPTSEDALPTGTYAPIPNDTLNQDSTVVPPSMTLEVDKWPLSADTQGDMDNRNLFIDVVTYDPSKHTRDSPAQQRTTPEENSSTNTDETHNLATSNQDQTMEPPITISKVEVATFTLNMQEDMGNTSSSREEVIRDPSKNKSFSSEHETKLHPTKPEAAGYTYIYTPDDTATLNQDSTLLWLPTTLEKELFSSATQGDKDYATGSPYKITGDLSEDISNSPESTTTRQPLTQEAASPTSTDETNDDVSPNQDSTMPTESTKLGVEEETLSSDTQENMDNKTAAQDNVINDSSEETRYSSGSEITPQPSTSEEAGITTTNQHVDTGTLNQDSTMEPLTMRFEIEAKTFSFDTQEEMNNANGVLNIMTESSTNTDMPDDAASSNQDSTMVPISTKSKVEEEIPSSDTQENMNNTIEAQDEVTNDPSEKTSNSSEDKITLQSITAEGSSPTPTYAPDDTATLNQDSTMGPLTMTFEVEATRLYLDTQEELNNANRVLNLMAESSTNTDTSDLAASLSQDSTIVLSSTTTTQSKAEEETPSSDAQENMNNRAEAQNEVTIDSSKKASNSSENEITLQSITSEDGGATSTKAPDDTVTLNQDLAMGPLTMTFETEAKTLFSDTQEEINNANGVLHIITESPTNTDVPDDAASPNPDSTMVLFSTTATHSKVEEDTPSSDTYEDTNNITSDQDEVTYDFSEETRYSSTNETTLQSIKSEDADVTSINEPDETATLNQDSTMGSLTMTFEVEAKTLFSDTQEEVNNANGILNIITESPTNTDTPDDAAFSNQDPTMVPPSAKPKVEEEMPRSDTQENNATEAQDEVTNDSSKKTSNSSENDITLQSITSEVEGATSTKAPDDTVALNQDSTMGPLTMTFEIEAKTLFSDTQEKMNNANGVLHTMTGRPTNTHTPNDAASPNPDSTMVLFSTTATQSKVEEDTPSSDTYEDTNNVTAAPNGVTNDPNEETKYISANETTLQPITSKDADATSTYALDDTVTLNQNSKTIFSDTQEEMDDAIGVLYKMTASFSNIDTTDDAAYPNQDSTIVLPSTKPKEESPGSDTQEDTDNTTEAQEEVTNDTIEETRYSSANIATLQPITSEDASATSSNDDTVTLNQYSTMGPLAMTFEVETRTLSLDTQEEMDNGNGVLNIMTESPTNADTTDYDASPNQDSTMVLPSAKSKVEEEIPRSDMQESMNNTLEAQEEVTNDPSAETNDSPKNKTIKLPPRISEGSSSTTVVVSDDDFTTNQDSTIAPGSTTSEEEIFSPHTFEDKDNATGSVVFNSDSEEYISDYTENKTISQPTAPEIPKSNTTDASNNTATSNQDSTMVPPSRTSDREEKTLGSEAKKDTVNSARSPNIVKSDFNEDTNDSLKYRTTLQLIKSAGESGMATDPSDDTVTSNYDSTMEPPSSILQIEESTPSPNAQKETYIATARWLDIVTNDPSKGTIDSPENESPLQSITTKDTRPGDTADVTDDTANSYQDSTMMATITITPGTGESTHNEISGLEVVNSDHREDMRDSPQQPKTAKDESLSTTDAIDGASAQNEDSAMVLPFTISEIKEEKLSTDAQEEYMVNTTASLDVVTSEASVETSDSSVNETTLQPDSTAIDDAASSKSNAEEKLRVSSDKKKEIANITTIVHYTEDEATLQLRTAGDANSNTTDAINYLIILNPDSTIIAPSTISEVKEGPFSRDVQEEIDKDTYFDVVTDKLGEDSINSSVNGTIEAIDDAASSKKDLKMVPPVTTSEIDEETLSSHVQEDTDSTTQGQDAVTSDSSEATTVSPENEATLQPKTLKSPSSTTIDVPDITSNSTQDSTEMSPSTKSYAEEETFSSDKKKEVTNGTAVLILVTSVTRENTSDSTEYEATLQLRTAGDANSNTTDAINYTIISNQDSTIKASSTTSEEEKVTFSPDAQKDIYKDTYFDVVTDELSEDTSNSSATTIEAIDDAASSKNELKMMLLVTTSEIEEETLSSHVQEDTDNTTQSPDAVTSDSSEAKTLSPENEATSQQRTLEISRSTTNEVPDNAANFNPDSPVVLPTTALNAEEDTLSSDVEEDNVTSVLVVVTSDPRENTGDEKPSTTDAIDNATISNQDTRMKLPSGTTEVGENTLSVEVKEDTDITTDLSEGTSDPPELETTLQVRTTEGESPTNNDEPEDATTSDQDSTIVPPSMTTVAEEETVSSNEHFDTDKTTADVDVSSLDPSENESDSAENETTVQPITSEGVIPALTIELDDSVNLSHESSMVPTTTKTKIEKEILSTDSKGDTDVKTSGLVVVSTDHGKDISPSSGKETTLLHITKEVASSITTEVHADTTASNQHLEVKTPSSSPKVQEEYLSAAAQHNTNSTTLNPYTVMRYGSEDTIASPEKGTTLQATKLESINRGNTDPSYTSRVEENTLSPGVQEDTGGVTSGTTLQATKLESIDRGNTDPSYTSRVEENTLSPDVQQDTSGVTTGPINPSKNSSYSPEIETIIQFTIFAIASNAPVDTANSSQDSAMVIRSSTLEESTFSANTEVDIDKQTARVDVTTSDPRENTNDSPENKTSVKSTTSEEVNGIPNDAADDDDATANQNSTMLPQSAISELDEDKVTQENTENAIGSLEAVASDFLEHETTLKLTISDGIDSTTNDVLDNAVTANQYPTKMPPSAISEEDSLRSDAQKYTNSTTADPDVVTRDPSEDTSDSPEKETTLQPMAPENASPTTTEATDNTATSYQDSTIALSSEVGDITYITIKGPDPLTAGYANPITREAIDDAATSNEHSNISSPFTTSEIAEKKVSSNAQEDTHNATADIEPIKLESATTVEAVIDAAISSEKLIRELSSTTLELEEKTYTPEAQDSDSTTADLDIVSRNSSKDSSHSPESETTLPPTALEGNPTTTKLTNDAETLNQDSTMRLSTILGEEEKTIITTTKGDIDNTTAELDVTISDTSDHTSVSFENETTLLPTTLEGASLTTTDSSNDNTTLNQVSIIVQPSITSELITLEVESPTTTVLAYDDTTSHQDSTMKAPSTTSTVEEGKLSPEIDWDMENTTVIIEERTDSSETEATPQPTTPEDASSIIIDASDDDATSNDDSTMKPPRLLG